MTVTQEDAVFTLARELAGGVLFTSWAGQAAGEEIRADIVVRSVGTVLSAREAGLLRAHLLTTASRRAGMLRTASGRALARITAAYLPERIPDRAVRRALEETDVPLGAALAPLGLRREHLEAEPGSGDVVLRVTARLWLPCPCPCAAGQWPVALVTEHVRDGALDSTKARG